jgi:hypothetical protein
VGDLGLAGALLEHAGGAQSDPFHLLEVAAVASGWACCPGGGHDLLPQPELLGGLSPLRLSPYSEKLLSGSLLS